MTRLALQLPNFTFPGVSDAQLFERVASAAATAEEAGFDTVFVMDHFYQLPMLGPPQSNMLEAYTLLGALAARTRRARLGTMVTGNTYRNPALLAKIVTTLDVVSGGRAVCGIGTGWFELEHEGYGFDFPPIGERMDRLEEALQILRPLLHGERSSFSGRHYRTRDAINSPAPLQRGGIPILIGGGGEKRTLALVARYAEESNLPCAPEEIPRKLEALAGHCARAGRRREDVAVSWLGSVILAPTTAKAEAARDEFLRQRGMDYARLPDVIRERVDAALVLGDPDTVSERLARDVLGRGVDGLVVNLPANGHEPDAVRLAGETLGKLLR
jgi:F420-dependent oxidoreductase-like protein